MKPLLLLAFVIWAFYLWYGVEHATEEAVPCQAARRIAPNDRINTGDLSCTPKSLAARYVGLYAGSEIAAKSPVHLGVLVDAPALRLSAGEALFELNKVNSVAETDDAGTAMTLQVDGKTEPVRGRLISVICESPRDNLCKPVFAVPEDKLAILAQAKPDAIKVAR
jgi:hypothetical protein